MGAQSDRRFRPRQAREKKLKPNPPRRQDHADSPRHARPHRSAAHARGSRRHSSPTTRRTRSPKWWTACSPRRTTANAGAGTGWTWRATRTPTASRPTRRGPTSGATATTSFEAFNQDKPYDRFIREQIAGDELYPDDLECPDRRRLQPALHRRNQPARHLNCDARRSLNDITDTVGAAFLGLTYGCARCHDHKFDPILHKDYYRLQAFFANIREQDDLVLLSGARDGGVQGATR